MLETIRTNKKIFYFVFFALVIPAYILNIIYSEGFDFEDEHFQILEFAKYKLGELEEKEIAKLAWEFPAKMRPALQPFIAYGIIKFARFFSLSDEMAVLFLRLLSGILGFSCYLLLLNQSFPKIKNNKFSYLSLIFCLTIWFLPYCQVRFSSENWSGIFFWLAFYLILQDKRTSFKLLIAGVFLGLSFQFRYQIGFCIMGLFLWLWIIRERFKITKLIILPFLSMSILIVLVTYYIDSWLYGEFVIPAYNYFYQNIISSTTLKYTDQDRNTLIFYFLKGAEVFIFPFGVFFIAMIVSFVCLKPKHPFTWVILPFFIIHLLLSNKQLRFMYPLIYVLPIIIILTSQILFESKMNKYILNQKWLRLKIYFAINIKHILKNKWFILSLKIYFVVNTIILFNRGTYPANLKPINMNFLKEDLHQNFKDKTAYIISILPSTVYYTAGMSRALYQPKNLIEIQIQEKRRDLHIKKQIKEFQKNKINYFYLNFLHTSSYQGLPLFPKNLQSIEKKCTYLFNMLDNKRIKYNIYRLLHRERHLQSIYFCKI